MNEELFHKFSHVKHLPHSQDSLFIPDDLTSQLEKYHFHNHDFDGVEQKQVEKRVVRALMKNENSD